MLMKTSKIFFKYDKKGFSLLEVLLTMILISIAASVVLPVGKVMIVQNKEEELKDTLKDVRNALEKYKTEKGSYPVSLDTLLQNRYLRRLDNEPFGGTWQYNPATGTHTWLNFVTSYTDAVYFVNHISYVANGTDEIYDIRSSTEFTGLNGTVYTSW
ncbi:MAG: type II secretion system protein [Candidatus Wallbacteria bacterium]